MKNCATFKLNSSNICGKQYISTKGKYVLNMISTFESLEYRFEIYMNDENTRKLHTSWDKVNPKGKVDTCDLFDEYTHYEYRVFDDCMNSFRIIKDILFKKLECDLGSKQKIRLSVEFRHDDKNYISTPLNIIQEGVYFGYENMYTTSKTVTYIECEYEKFLNKSNNVFNEEIFKFDIGFISDLVREREDYIEKVNTRYEEYGFDYLKFLIAK